MTIASTTAHIDKSAQIGKNVTIEPYAYIGKDVILEDNVTIRTGARVEYATIGEGSIIYSGAMIGTEPQDLGYKGEPTSVLIGKNCQIREYATVNRASGEGNVTKVGNNCLLMTNAHVAHNCVLEDEVIFANLVTIGGHCTVGKGAFIGGMTVAHQNVRIGRMCIISGFSGTRADVPPFAKADGRPVRIVGTNVIGLRRRGLNQEERTALKNAYKVLFYSSLPLFEGIKKVEETIAMNEYVEHLLDFCRTTKRGIVPARSKKVEDEE